MILRSKVHSVCMLYRPGEWLPMVQMESQHSIGMPTCRDFPRFVFISQISWPEVGSRWRCSRFGWPFWKKTLYRQIFKNVFREDSSRLIYVLCANFMKFSWPEVREIACCLPDKKNFLLTPRSRFCVDRTHNLPGPAPDNILGAAQISSIPIHFRRSYSRTCERRWNAPQNLSSTHRSYSFFAE